MDIKHGLIWTVWFWCVLFALGGLVSLMMPWSFSLGILMIVLPGSVGLSGVFFLNGLKKITTDPPHKAVITMLGKRQQDSGVTAYVDEGWHFFPFYPFFYGFIMVNVERSTQGIDTTVRTPDRAEEELPTEISFRPDPDHLIEYIDSGREEGVREHLTAKIQERAREWTAGSEEGPADWRELYRSQAEATSVLIKAVLGNKLIEIPHAQEIPTYILLRFFSKPQPQKTLTNEEDWAKDDWKKVRDILGDLSEEDQEEVEEAVEKRRIEIKKLRAGDARFQITDIGVFLERLNVSDTKLIGEVAKAAESEAREREERAAEVLELNHVRKQIKETVDKLECSEEEARAIVQSERGKVAQTLDEKRISLSPETREVVPGIIAALARKGGD